MKLMIRNWEKHQHYKHRRPPWVKFYIELLEDDEMSSLPEASRLTACLLLLVAANRENKIPANPAWLSEELGLDEHDCEQAIQDLLAIRFLVWEVTSDGVSASTSASNGASLFRSTETETETETKHSCPQVEEQAIYDSWRGLHGKQDKRYEKISPQRLAKIRARRREFSDAELVQALTAAANDDWPERSKHNDLTVLFRSREKVDAWLERGAPARVGASTAAARYAS